MFPRGNIRKTFTVVHYPVFEYQDTLSFAFLICIILYIDDKQVRCSVFTFVQHISFFDFLSFLTHITVADCLPNVVFSYDHLKRLINSLFFT